MIFFYIYKKCETLKGLDSQLFREYMFFGEVIVAQLLTNALRKYNCAMRLLRGILVNMLCHSLFLKFFFFLFVCLFRHGNWQSIPSLILKGILQDAITLHRIQIIFILLYYIGIFKAIVNKLFKKKKFNTTFIRNI